MSSRGLGGLQVGNMAEENCRLDGLLHVCRAGSK